MTHAPGELEYEVLKTVSGLGRCTVREVHQVVGAPRGVVYTTTAKVLERLAAKGLLACDNKGAALVYRTTKRAKGAERVRVRQLVARIVGSDPAPAIAHLVDALESIDPGLLTALSEEICARKKASHGT